MLDLGDSGSWSKESNNIITQVEASIKKWLSSEPKKTSKVTTRINTSMCEIKHRTATPKQVRKLTETFNSQMENVSMNQVKDHSLKWLPKYHYSKKPQKYLLMDDVCIKSTLAKFRLG